MNHAYDIRVIKDIFSFETFENNKINGDISLSSGRIKSLNKVKFSLISGCYRNHHITYRTPDRPSFLKADKNKTKTISTIFIIKSDLIYLFSIQGGNFFLYCLESFKVNIGRYYFL